MKNKNTSTHYTRTAIFLHWILAFSLITLFSIGLYMTSLPFSPFRLKLYNWHKWAGICILILSLIRLIWKIMHRPPDLPESIQSQMPTWQKIAHHGTHHLLYLLFFIVPLSGWIYSSAMGYQIILFGVFPLPDFVSADKAFAELIKPIHKMSAILMMILSFLHIAAALKHQFIDRDHLISRMIPHKN